VIASQLLSKLNVQQRIAELGQERLDAVDVSADGVVRMLADSYKDAKAAKQHGPAVRAAELLGKRHTMFSDRVVQEERNTDPEEQIKALSNGNQYLERILRATIFGETVDKAFLARLVREGPEVEPVTGWYSGGRPH
jgi:hypothetical protein